MQRRCRGGAGGEGVVQATKSTIGAEISKLNSLEMAIIVG